MEKKFQVISILAVIVSGVMLWVFDFQEMDKDNLLFFVSLQTAMICLSALSMIIAFPISDNKEENE